MQGRGLALFFALGSGALYGLLFPPFSLGWLAWLALVPLLVAAARSSVPWAALCGVVWAVTATIGVAWWLPDMLDGFFDVPLAGGWLALVGAGLLVNAPAHAAFTAWLAWSSRRGSAAPWAVGAAWAVAEFARAHGFIANPVGLIAYSQTGTPFAQLADLAGPYGIGALLVAVNAAFANAFVRSPAGFRRQLLPLAAAGGVVAFAFAYGQWQLGSAFTTAPGVRVAVVQGGFAREPHWDRARRDEYLDRYLALTSSAGKHSIAFWPEFAVDFYLVEDTPHRRRLADTLRALDTILVTGAAHYRFGDERTHYFNSVFVVDRTGEVADRYDKHRLIPFAEYGPFGGLFSSDTAVYEPGRAASVLPVSGLRIGAFICGEAVFPEVARALVRNGADVLANPSNDYWFRHPAAQEHQLAMASLRAIENRRFLVRPTSTGVSAVLDAHGRAVVRTTDGGGTVLEAVVRPSQATTLYQTLGDAPVGLALAIVILGAGPLRRASRDVGGDA